MKILSTRLYIICFCCLPCSLYAQQTFTINGIIYRNSTSDRIAQATITDLKSNVIMMSDELGGFNIVAAKGDTLLVNRTGYTPLKQVVTGANDLILYLQPVIVLNEVTIQSESKRQELNDVMADYRSQGVFYDGKPPALSFLTSPVTGLYELFGKTPNEARRFKIYSQDELEHAEVSKRYNAAVVKQVTKLTDDNEVKKFMDSYTPSYDDIKSWNDYELISHIKKAFAYYEKNKNTAPPAQKLY